MCSGRDSNPHALRHNILSVARLTSYATRACTHTSVKQEFFQSNYFVEVQAGIEPAHVDFADQCVTTSPLHRFCFCFVFSPLLISLNHFFNSLAILFAIVDAEIQMRDKVDR